MSPDKKNQNNPNNYDFILNQQASGQPNAEKKTNKKVILLIALVLIAAAAIGLYMILGVSTNVQESEPVTYNTDQVNQATNVVEEFFKKATAEDIDGAYALFSNPAALTKDQFVNEAMPYLNKLDLSTCQPQANADGVVDEIDNIIQTYQCNSKSGITKVNLQFSVDSTPAGQTSIYGYYIVGSE